MDIFIGIVVSSLVQWIKTKFAFNSAQTMMFVISLSLVGGVVYQVLNNYGLWGSFWQVLVYASAFYALIIKNVSSLIKE